MTKTMTPNQIKNFTGKRVDSVKWIIPDGYERCAMTGKMLPESELEVSFVHYAFSIEARRAAGITSIEDASWLSEEGFYQILDALGISEREYSEIVDSCLNPAPVTETPAQPAAPVAEAAPVCGTCGGEGDCMDCDTLTVEAAREDLADMKQRALYAVLPNIVAQFAERIADLEAYIARKQPAPTDPRPDCTLCKGDGINASGGASCPACNGSGYETPLPIAQDDVLTDIEAFQDAWWSRDDDGNPITETVRAMALLTAAADEIRRLRDQLNDAKNDAQMMTEKYQAAQAEVVSIRNAANVAIDAFQADAETARGEVKALRELIAPRVEVKAITDPKTDETREYQWMVYIPQFMPHWSGFEARETWAREEAQKVIDSGKLPTLTKPA